MNTQADTCHPERLDALLRSELDSADERHMMRHLSDCAKCRDELDCRAADASSWDEAKQFLQSRELVGDSSHDGGQDGSQRSMQIDTVLNTLAPTDDPEMLGRLGGYEISGVIGSGAMGVVLKGFDRSLDRTVAIKVMAPHLASSGAARRRFAREAKAAAAVLHPNVMAIHSVLNDESLPYLVMPYVGSTSLQKRIEDDGPLSAEEVLRIGAQIAAGLAAAHAQGIVHRDIKPANVLLEEGVERVAITDFGLARAVDDATMTRTGVIAGTPQYMSPEQARGESIDQRSDLFSLGSLLYVMCTGRPPFRAETSYGVMRRIIDDEPRPIREINSEISEWLCAIIGKLLAKNVDDRFASAADVAELLKACLAHVQQPALAPLPDGIPPAAELAKSSRNGGATKIVAISATGRARQLIVGAIFGLALLFAGILIVLEFNKGKLIIESEADDIPIRIMLGDKVVERLAVHRTGTSVRVSAGTYIVEIDGAADGMTVKDGRVALKRRGEEVVSIVRQAGKQGGSASSFASDLSPGTGMRGGPQRSSGSRAANDLGGSQKRAEELDPASKNDAGKNNARGGGVSSGGSPESSATRTTTAAEAIRLGEHLNHSRERVRVQFRVGSALSKIQRDAEGTETEWLVLKSKPGTNHDDSGALYVWLSDEVAGAWKLESGGFAGEWVEAEGVVSKTLKRGGKKIVGDQRPDERLYSIRITSNEHFRILDGPPILTAAEGLRRGHELSESGQPVRVRFRVLGVHSFFNRDNESTTLVLTSHKGKQGFEHLDDQSLHIWLPEKVRSEFKLSDDDFIGRTIEVEGVVVYTGAGPAYGPDLYSIKVTAADQLRVVEAGDVSGTKSGDRPPPASTGAPVDTTGKRGTDPTNVESVASKVLTPSEAVERGKPITVQFRVRSVRESILSSLRPTDSVNPQRFSAQEFSVIVGSEGSSRTAHENLRGHYLGHVVEVRGMLETITTEIYGNPDLQRWYRIAVGDLDAIRIVESKDLREVGPKRGADKPLGGGDYPSNASGAPRGDLGVSAESTQEDRSSKGKLFDELIGRDFDLSEESTEGDPNAVDLSFIEAFDNMAEARRRAIDVLRTRRTAASLVNLLKLNGDTTTNIEKLGHPAGVRGAGIGAVAEIRSDGRTYVAVVARRYDPDVDYRLVPDGMGIAFLFDQRGNLKARFGGNLSSDRHGEEVNFLTLGTKDRWFVQVRCFEEYEKYSRRFDMYVVQEGFPLAFRFRGSGMSWTSEPYNQAARTKHDYFCLADGLDLEESGLGADGHSYSPVLGWDGTTRNFIGASQLTKDGKPIYQIDLSKSDRFLAIDKQGPPTSESTTPRAADEFGTPLDEEPESVEPTDAASLASPTLAVDLHVMSGKRQVRGATVTLLVVSGRHQHSRVKGSVATTDEKGIARLTCPKYIPGTTELTKKFSCFVEHPDFAATIDNNLYLSDEPATVQLEPGFRIAATALDGRTKEPIRDDLHGTGGFLNITDAERWEMDRSGSLVSPRRSDIQRAFRVVHDPTDGPLRFSEVLLAKRRPQQRVVKMGPIAVQPGTRVVGDLDTTAQRPIKNGRVIALIHTNIRDPARNAQILNEWVEWTPISEDGSFVFESLPKGEEAQFVAVCDGYVSAMGPPVTGMMGGQWPSMPRYWQPQTRKLLSDRVRVELAMEPASRLVLRLKDGDGKPVEGAEVTAEMRYSWQSRYGDIVRTRFRTIDGLRGKRDFPSSPSTGTSNAEGTVKLDNLFGVWHGLTVEHHRFEMPADPETPHTRRHDVKLGTGEQKEVTLVLHTRRHVH